MSEIVPPSLISQHHHFLNKKMTDGFAAAKQKPEDSKIQGVVLPCIPKSSPSVLFVSAMSPDVVLNQVPEMEIDRQGNKRKKRLWNKKRSE
jgi:hypothetical protein